MQGFESNNFSCFYSTASAAMLGAKDMVHDPKASAAFQWEDFPLSVPRLVSQISKGHLKRNTTPILCRCNNQ